MHYSFSSVLMAFITSNVLLVVISLCLRSGKIMVNAGYKLLALFLVFSFLRFLFPFELPFSINIPFPKALSTIVQVIRYRSYSFCGYRFSMWTIMEFIWVIGILFNLYRNYKVRKLTVFLISFGKDLTDLEPYASILAQVCQNKKKSNVFRIIELNGLQVPMLYGIFSPCILLPKGMPLSQEDLYYSFCHEISHHYHHDLVIKNIVSFLMIFYWWNPASYALKRQLDLIIEMRIDDDLTAAGPEVTAAYLNCLIHIKEYMLMQKLISDRLSASILRDDRDDLAKRFEMIYARNSRRRHSLNVLITVVIVSVYVLSYLFIFEAYYTPQDNPRIWFPPSNNSYLINNGDSSYDL